MTEHDNTEDKKEKQAALVASLEAAQAAQPVPVSKPLAFTSEDNLPPREYDQTRINEFLDAVFHAEMDEDEHILTWRRKPLSGGMGYPKSDEDTENFVQTSKKAMSLYFGTSTCAPHPDDGKLYNRGALFRSLRVVVLDDIGTKVPFSKIPDTFTPSYKIETSEGNFQYGYILAEPVRDFAAATALIQLVYESGASDEGGKMPCKIVRLPEGVNGKKGKAGFVSVMTELNDAVYTPQDLLDALELNASWDDILEDAEAATKSRASRSVGASPWSPLSPVAAALNGFIDPVLEWLYETDNVKDDNGHSWVSIACPWGEGHSSGDGSASYMPLGRGDDVTRRGFNCFHDSCAGNNTSDMLSYVAVNGGPEAGVTDPAAALASQYVFDTSCNSVRDIKSFRRDRMMTLQAFTTAYPHSVTVQRVDGKPKAITETSLWKTSKSRVTVSGATYDPSTTSRIVDRDDELFVNLFSIPAWGKGPINHNHVAKFIDYLEYLIPDELARDYFLHWLAAKCQDMTFRGAALVMVATKQGVGRSTLADMIKTLIGEPNVADVPLRDMLGDSGFNEWREKPFIVSEETLSTGGNADAYGNYERLKTFIDPRTATVSINPKYGLKRESKVHSSYLFLTNHANALAIPAGDRRFFIMENAPIPAEPAVFSALNEWLRVNDADGMPSWGRSVYRWLQTRTVNIEELTAPPPTTETKEAMAANAENNADFAVRRAVELWPHDWLTIPEIFEVLDDPALSGAIHFEEEHAKKYARIHIKEHTISYGSEMVIRLGSQNIRPRVTTDAYKKERVPNKPKTKAGLPTIKNLAKLAYSSRVTDPSAIALAIHAEMVAAGRV